MAIVRYSKNEFEKHVKLSESVLNKINMFGTPVLVKGNEIEIEINPDRPDLIPMLGFLRAFKAFIGKEKGLKEYKIKKPEKNYDVYIKESVKGVRPFTSCAIIKNLKLDDVSIKDLIKVQEKLHTTIGRNRKKVAIGIYPLEKIKLPITYEARNPKDINFVPLEGTRLLNSKQILRSHPAGKSYSHLLENFSEYPVFVDASGKILSMPPIINSEDTGKVTRGTKEVFIECSGFDKKSLQKTLNIIVTALAEDGAEIYSMNIHDDKKEISPNLDNEITKIDIKRINKLLGTNILEKELYSLLGKMGHDYHNGYVTSPPWRTDLLHEVDIIEDIAIAYGYEKLIPEIPKVATNAEESKAEKIKRKINEILVGQQLIEISSYHFIKHQEAKRMKLIPELEVEDAKTDYKLLRPNLLVSALRILSENKDHEYPQNIFEIGKVFSKSRESETGIKEEDNLIVALSPGKFTEAKQVLKHLMQQLNVKFKLKEGLIYGLIEGRIGLILINGKEVGYIGEVHPLTLRSWNAKMPLSVFEINLDYIIDMF